MSGINYLWDPVEDNIVREIDDSGTVIAQYTTEPGLHGDLLSQHRDGKSSYYHFDGQGNTTCLTDENGDITDTYAYNAFGEVTERTGNTVNPFQFGGQKGYYRDEETGEYQVRRRPLSGKQGRWLSSDPLFALWGEAGPNSGMAITNRPLSRSSLLSCYLYAHNNPNQFLDPSGLSPDCAVDCAGKEMELNICIIYWGTKTLTLKELKLDEVNKIWKQCCVKFTVADDFQYGDVDVKRLFPPDGVFDDSKEDHRKAMTRAKFKVDEKFQDSCIFINVFSKVMLEGAESLGGYFLDRELPLTSDRIVFDPAKLSEKFPIELVLAHELGHKRFNKHCDEIEPPCDESSLMHSSPTGTKLSDKECKKFNSNL